MDLLCNTCFGKPYDFQQQVWEQVGEAKREQERPMLNEGKKRLHFPRGSYTFRIAGHVRNQKMECTLSTNFPLRYERFRVGFHEALKGSTTGTKTGYQQRELLCSEGDMQGRRRHGARKQTQHKGRGLIESLMQPPTYANPTPVSHTFQQPKGKSMGGNKGF